MCRSFVSGVPDAGRNADYRAQRTARRGGVAQDRRHGDADRDADNGEKYELQRKSPVCIQRAF